MRNLLCTVRACARPLAHTDRSLLCANGHRFDLARTGYVNLLQPQDRRSRTPGDSAEVVAARRQLLEQGLGAPLATFLDTLASSVEASGPLAVLDIGCGEGYYLQTLAAARAIEAHGVDISVSAIEAAARRMPGATWVVANADRGLPFAADSQDLVLSITGRLPALECRRVLRSSGLLVVVVPSADDLLELRERVLGRGVLRDRRQRLKTELDSHYSCQGTTSVRHRVWLSARTQELALTATYRIARPRRAAGGLVELTDAWITTSWDVVWLRPR